MQMIVTLKLEIDPAMWDQAFGTGTKAADVRDDVKAYVLGLIHGCAATDEDGIRTAQIR